MASVSPTTHTSSNVGVTGERACLSWSTASRNSSKHEIERNVTMARAPSVSNFA
jgi:hypothetical protein